MFVYENIPQGKTWNFRFLIWGRRLKILGRSNWDSLVGYLFNLNLKSTIRNLKSLFGAGVDGLVAVAKGSNTACAFLWRSVHGFKKDLKSNFFVFLDRLRKARFVCCEPLYPSFFLKFLFPAHFLTLITLTLTLSHRGRGENIKFKLL